MENVFVLPACGKTSSPHFVAPKKHKKLKKCLDKTPEPVYNNACEFAKDAETRENQTKYAALVKWSRRSPLTAESGVRLP